MFLGGGARGNSIGHERISYMSLGTQYLCTVLLGTGGIASMGTGTRYYGTEY